MWVMPYRPLQLTEPEALRLAATARGHGAEAELASYLLIRVPVSIDEQVHYWTGWAVVTAMSTVASVAVVGIIIARHRLRISVYNHFIVGLAIPEYAPLRSDPVAFRAATSSRRSAVDLFPRALTAFIGCQLTSVPSALPAVS